MKPLVDIRRVGPSAYTYVVGTATETGASVATPPDSAFGTLEFTLLESCLADLGNALEPYFQRVELQFAGCHLGSCSTQYLRRAPLQLAALIRKTGVAA